MLRKLMTVGTKSLLFGVHQFIWHPLVVAKAWKQLYGKWPTWEEWVAISVHDWGYWGCRDMDGPGGVNHPVFGAKIARGVVFFFHRDRGRAERIYKLVLGHSGSFAGLSGVKKSALCGPDKCSILFEPWWFYRIRASLSGELSEYVSNGPDGLTSMQWFRWLQDKFRKKYVSPGQGKNSQLRLQY